MGSSILSQDIVAIALVVADGNINMSIEEVLVRVEKYQDDENRRFGECDSDYRDLFHWLTDTYPPDWGIFDVYFRLDEIKFRAAIPFILKCVDAYFNDEGEHWCGIGAGLDLEICSKLDPYWCRYDQSELAEKIKLKADMIQFFLEQDSETLTTDLVQKFMKEHNITVAILEHCSRKNYPWVADY